MNYCEIKGKKIGEGKPKICIPLVGRTRGQILEQLENIIAESKNTTIDMVEFRGDFYEDLGDFHKLDEILKEVADKLSSQNIILLFTIRSQAEGGEQLSFTAPSIFDINSFVIEHRLADMVDVELGSGEERSKNLIDLAKECGVKIIMSNHDFNTTPSKDEIVSRLVRMQQMGADIAKIAAMPENMTHVFTLLQAIEDMKVNHSTTPVVTISMGKLGAISRLSGEIFGSAVTFATVGDASAPGQIPAREINTVIDIMHKYCVM